MSDDQKENCSAKAKKKRRKRSFSCLSFCFAAGSGAVSDPDVHPPAAGSSRNKSLTSLLSWSHFRNKVKRRAAPAPVEIVPPVTRRNTTITSTTHHAQEEKKKEKKKLPPAAKINASKEAKRPSQEFNSISDSRLPVISPRYNACHDPTTINSDRVQTELTTNQPNTLMHIGHPRIGPVNSGSSAVAQILGLWVMVTTLAIMMLAGRIVAVFWFCSSLYVLRHRQHRRRPTIVNEDSNQLRDLNMNSDEHKKRVVLEGLLERNGKRPSLAGFSGVRRVYNG